MLDILCTYDALNHIFRPIISQFLCFVFKIYNIPIDYIHIFFLITNTIFMKIKIPNLLYNTKEYGKDFLLCGFIGWCVEIIFTSFHSFCRNNKTLIGHTSIWMFPIYGCAIFLKPISKILKHQPAFLRGSIYAMCIYFTEFVSGILLMKQNACPWNYHRCRWQIRNVIRLDFAPYWFCIGLFFETILNRHINNPKL